MIFAFTCDFMYFLCLHKHLRIWYTGLYNFIINIYISKQKYAHILNETKLVFKFMECTYIFLKKKSTMYMV